MQHFKDVFYWGLYKNTSKFPPPVDLYLAWSHRIVRGPKNSIPLINVRIDLIFCIIAAFKDYLYRGLYRNISKYTKNPTPSGPILGLVPWDCQGTLKIHFLWSRNV